MKNSLHYKLRASHTICNKTIIQELQQITELRSGEPKILEFLAENEPCEQKAIALGCDLDPASVTGILGRMEERGLIKRETHPGNRRSLFVSMTDIGQKSFLSVEKIFEKVDSSALKDFTNSEKAELFRLLDKLYFNLKENNHEK